MRRARAATGRSTVHEVREEPARSGSADLVREREGERLLDAVPAGAHGRRMRADGTRDDVGAVRAWLQELRERARDVAIVIGGAFGLGAVVRAASVALARARAVDAAARARAAGARRAAVSRRHDRSRRAVPQMMATRDARDGGCVSDEPSFAPSRSADRRCRARRAPAQLPQWYRPRRATPTQWRAYARSVARRACRPDWYRRAARRDRTRRGAAAARLERSANGQGHRRHDGTAARTVRRSADDAHQGDQRARARRRAPGDDRAFRSRRCSGRRPTTPISTKRPSCRSSLDGGARELRLEQRAPAGTPMARVPIDERDRRARRDAARRVRLGAASRRISTRALDAYRRRRDDRRRVRRAAAPRPRAARDRRARRVASRRRRARGGRCLQPRATSARRASRPRSRGATRGDRRRGIQAAGRRQSQVCRSCSRTPTARSDDCRSPRRRRSSERRDDIPVADGAAAARDRARDRSRPRRMSAGPGEVAYFAQVSAVADALGVPTPLVVPRWSATIVEPRVQRDPRRARR